jgi:hydrogenase nickel incorporation protein HypA/HybF
VHELSIAQAIVAIAETHADGRRVTSVEVRIGRLRAVVPAALSFSWELATEATAIEGAELEIVDVPLRVACRDCAAESQVDDFPLACPGCGSIAVGVVAGEELQVTSLELEQEDRPVISGTRRSWRS